jgi:hypothetical protein
MGQKHNHWKLKEKDKWKQFYKKILPQTPVNARGLLQLRGVSAEIARGSSLQLTRVECKQMCTAKQ